MLLFSAGAAAQAPLIEWPFDDGYRDQMLYLHALVNYGFDLDWQADWERRQFSGNALRINTGSVSSTELLTDVDLNINESLNEKWRFMGRYTRSGLRQEPSRDELLLLGLERSILEASAVYLSVNPEFDKEFLDIAAGYTHYGADREQYVRIGVLVEDLNWDTKNAFGAKQNQRPAAVEWAVRLALPNSWWIYSEGKFGTGFERFFPDAAKSPDVVRHDRRDRFAELRLTRTGKRMWSLWLDWYDFSEQKQYRQPGFDYDYGTTVLDVGVEHTRLIDERHRLRLLAHIVDQQSESIGFMAHDYDRRDVFAGAFYEYLRPSSGITFAYAFGKPDIVHSAPDPGDRYSLDDYRDKIIVAYRYTFSDDARILLSVSHEVSAKGFGGGAVQFQMFF